MEVEGVIRIGVVVVLPPRSETGEIKSSPSAFLGAYQHAQGESTGMWISLLKSGVQKN